MNPKTKPPAEKLATQTIARKSEIEEIERVAIANYQGQLGTLESAIGLLRLGDHVGWRVLVVVHGRTTVRKYEGILGIKVKEFFPETGPSSYRSVGYNAASKLKNFWDATTGVAKVPEKNVIEK